MHGAKANRQLRSILKFLWRFSKVICNDDDGNSLIQRAPQQSQTLVQQKT
jgi:hypothetical protein